MAASEKISVISVTYNSQEVIEKALFSVANHPIYVVDNASIDETCNIIKRKFPKVNLIENQHNLGFGVANNIALGKIDTEFALLLNPDAYIDENCLDELLIAADKYPDAAIIAPEIAYPNGKIQETYKQSVFDREKNRTRFIAPEGDLCADFVSGAIMLLRISAFRKIGFFDPNIFLFYEDDDLCMKAKDAGFSVILAHKAKAFHLFGESSKQSYKTIEFKQKHLTLSRLYLEEKYQNGARFLRQKIFFESIFKFLLYSIFLNFKKSKKYLGRLKGVLQSSKTNSTISGA